MMELDILLNGARCHVTCAPGDTLLAVLRRLGCFSVRYGSLTGETGAAAVLVDGRLISADVLLAAQADGHDITTVEALNVATGEMHPIQAAFVDAGALQSGYSAGAMVLAAKALLERNPDPTDAEIRDALSGILDRETGYVKVVEAVRRAAAALRNEKPDRWSRSSSSASPGIGPPPPPALDAPLAVPRLVLSPDVRADGGRRQAGAQGRRASDWSRATRRSPTTSSCAGCCTAEGAAQPPRPRPYRRHRRLPRPGRSPASTPSPLRQHASRQVLVGRDRAGPTRSRGTRSVSTTRCATSAIGWRPSPRRPRRSPRRRAGGSRSRTRCCPAVFDQHEAIAGGAPVIHDEADTDGIYDASRNISHHIEGQTVSDAAHRRRVRGRRPRLRADVPASNRCSTARSSRTSRSAGSTRTSGWCCARRRRCRSTCAVWSHRCSACRSSGSA